MDYITRFYTTAEFTVAEPNLARPHVSLTKDNYVVHYMPVASQGGSQGGDTPVVTHDYVEIAGMKWATCNVGAENPWDTGLYFQWGDTQGYTADQVGDGEGLKYFSWEDYKYAEFDPNGGSNGSGSGSGSGSGGGTYNMTKYNENDGLTVLEASDDAVTAAWGGSWRMPTSAELQELFNAVNIVSTSDYQGSGVAGFICTDKTDSSKVLFFPACGDLYKGDTTGIGTLGYYWSSLRGDGNALYAYGLFFNDLSALFNAINDFFAGCTVRGVLDEQTGSGSGSSNG